MKDDDLNDIEWQKISERLFVNPAVPTSEAFIEKVMAKISEQPTSVAWWKPVGWLIPTTAFGLMLLFLVKGAWIEPATLSEELVTKDSQDFTEWILTGDEATGDNIIGLEGESL